MAKGPRLVSAIRGDLDWITLKAVQPNRVERYATAEDLADDLQRFLDHRPVVAGAPTIAYRLRKQYEQRRATVLGSSAVIVTVLVAAILGGIGRWNRQQTKQATLGRVSKQVTSLVDQSDAARRRAGASEANAEAEFVTARTAIAKVESLLESYPSLVAEKQRFESVKSALHQDLAAFSLVAALNDARERATQIDANHQRDAFGRVAGLRMMTDAFRGFGITPAQSPPSQAADRLQSCPPSLHRKLIEALDFMITETPLGAGLYLHEQGGQITVAHLVEEGPAHESGKLQVGDRVLAIDGHDLVNNWQPTLTRAHAYRKLHRPPGETIQLTIVTGLGDPVTVQLTCNGHAAHWALEVLQQLDPDRFRMELRGAMLSADLETLRSLSRSDALRLQPAFTLIGLSGMLFLLDRSNGAIDYLRLAQRRHPGNFWANHYLGTALAVAHTPPRPQQSLQFLTAAVALRPNSIGARMNLAGALVRAGEVAAATEHVRIAQELAPESETVLWNLDWLQRIQPESLGETASVARSSSLEAKPNARPAPSVKPAPSVINAPAAGKLDSFDDDSIDQWQARARRFAAAGKRQEALRALALAEEKFAGDPRLRRAKGAVLVDLQDYTAARIVLSDAARLLPNDAEARFYYGVALQYCGDSEASIHEYRAALAIRPDYTAVHAFLDPLVNPPQAEHKSSF